MRLDVLARLLAGSLALAVWGACATTPPVEPTEPVDPFGTSPYEPIERCVEPAPDAKPEKRPCGKPAGAPGAARGRVGLVPPAPANTPDDPGTLDRADVDRFMENGPQWFIRQVDLEPARLGGEFVGYRIVRFFDDDRRFRRVDLRPGDVVLRVNDLPIGRPEQFMKVWTDLKVARALTVEYVRGGSQRLLRWEIVSDGELPEQVITGD